MRSKTLRQLFGAVAIAVTAATMHGAWFATTDAREAAPTLIVSTWDYYEKSWIEAPLDLGATTPSLRHSEDTIVAITGATALSFPAELNTIAIDGQGGRPSLASLEIPPAPAADASTTYLHLLVSKPANLAGSWPVLDPETPWTGPIDPTDDDLGALDVEGSVGVHTVTATVGAAPHDFTWDIGRWSKGDIFLGLNNHTYKVLDRNGNFKRFVASADYDEYQNGFTDDYNVTTGCATNWKTGEVFATNFGDYYPAVNIIGRHPVDSDLSPYSQASRRVVTRIDRTDDDQQAGYVNPYTGVNYPIDSSPESVAFDADMNMYVGHSFGNFRQAPAAWQGSADKLFEYDDEWTEYTMAVDGLPLEGWTWNDGWGYVVDETGVRMLLAPAGSPVGAFGVKQYGVEVSPRLSYVTDGQGLPTGLAMSTAGVLYPTAVPLPGWSADMALPQSFLSDPSTGTALYRLDGLGGIVESLIPSRWSIGKRLHKYFLQNGAYEATDAARDEFWTFSGRQGTDWIDLDVTGEVMYYTSEDSFIHRYRVKPGPNGEPVGQLPDVGFDLAIEGQPTFGKLAVAQNVAQGMTGGLLGDYRFHGMRILPPGDGTGGFLVAVENGLGVHRFSAEGKWLQRYYAHIDRDGLASTGTDGKEYLIGKWYTIEVDPGGQTFWASAHDSGWVFQFDIATGRILKQIEAVDYLVPNADPQVPEGRRVEGICIMWEYTAPQEICFVNGQPEGTDNDGDGYIDENCVAIEVCSVVSPGDDDGDGLGDQYDSDCAAEMPPVAIDDAYAMRQREFAPNPTVLSVGAADGVLKRGAVDDYDRDTGGYADQNALTVIGVGADEGSLAPLSAVAVATAKGGSVLLQSDGSFQYTPHPDFHGVDSFAYRITDGYPETAPARVVDPDRPDAGADDIATVTITVAPIVANDGVYQVWVGQTVSRAGGAADGLLANDAQFPVAQSAGPITVSEAGSAASPQAFTGSRTFATGQGNTVTVRADGGFDFTASNLAFGGLDFFVYAVHDSVSRSWNLATVSVNVNRPVVTVDVLPQSKNYDRAPLPTTCTVESSSPGVYTGVITYAGLTRGGVAYGPTSDAPASAGNYTATCEYRDPIVGTVRDTAPIVIAPIPAQVTAGGGTKTAWSPDPPLSPIQTVGFLAEDLPLITLTQNRVGGNDVGVYATNAQATGDVVSNYVVTYIPGVFTITGGSVDVQVTGGIWVYDGTQKPQTCRVTGWDGWGLGSGVLSYATASGTPLAQAPSAVGSYTVTCNYAGDVKYGAASATNTIVITPLAARVVAGNGGKVYGDADPALTAITTTGFLAADLPGIALAQSRVAGESVGSYDVNATATGGNSGNYTIEYVKGAFAITPRRAVVTAGTGTKVYGTADPALTAVTTTGFIAADLPGITLSQVRVAGETVGSYEVNATAGGGRSGNYTIEYVKGAFSITPAALTVRANNKTMVLGSPVPALDGTVTGVVAGDNITASYATANDGTVAGVFADVIVPTLADPLGRLSNYTVTVIPGTLTVLAVAPCTGNDGYTTYSQGGWGSKPSGNNPGALLARHFATVYGGGPVVIGGTYTLTFTSASAIEKFLPGGGTSKPLTASQVNPTKSAAGNIAAQLLALRLAVDFSAAGITKRGLGALVMQSGPLAGMSVDQILALANTVVGGQPGALPSGLSISGLASILESLNLNYHEGTVNQGLLACVNRG